MLLLTFQVFGNLLVKQSLGYNFSSESILFIDLDKTSAKKGNNLVATGLAGEACRVSAPLSHPVHQRLQLQIEVPVEARPWFEHKKKGKN